MVIFNMFRILISVLISIDAEAKDKDWFIWGIFALLFPVITTIVYLINRD